MTVLHSVDPVTFVRVSFAAYMFTLIILPDLEFDRVAIRRHRWNRLSIDKLHDLL